MTTVLDGPATREGVRILLVEDDPDDHAIVRAMLRDAGVEVDAGDPLDWIARRSTPRP